ncbi:MAG: DMT family transporter [Aureibaculum sp.]
MLNDRITNYLHLHLIVFIWGFTAILGALISIDAIPLVWFRILLAVIFIFIFIILRKISFKKTSKELFRFFIGGILIAVHWITFFYAIKISNVSVTLATMSTGAFFVTLIQLAVFRKKIIIYEVIFSLLAIVGLVIMFNAETEYMLGIIFALISAFLSASFSILNADLIKFHNATIISFYELFFAVIFITMLLFFNGTIDAHFFILSKADWVYLIILASICTAYAFVASTKVLKSVSPFTMMLTINLEPVYGIILAIIIFGQKEIMTPNFYYGALIILVTVILNGLIKYRPGLFRIKSK